MGFTRIDGHLGEEARKPIFKLTPGDGAIGNYAVAVQEAAADFKTLAAKILERIAPQPQLLLAT